MQENKLLSFRLSIKWYRRLTLLTAFSIWMLIVLGGLVRVTDSGTGCGSSWPMCNGRLIPSMDYHELIEWNHRFFATLVGFLMILTIGTTLLWYRRPRRLFWLSLMAGTTYVLQAIVGGITVLLNLDHTWIAVHMGNSMLLLASVILLALFSRIGPVKLVQKRGWLEWLALGTLIWTYIALFSGSAVIGSGSELSCPDWPLCNADGSLPSSVSEWVNFGHRLSVGVSDVLLIVVGLFIWRTRRNDTALVNLTRVLASLYVAQVLVGAFTIWLKATPFMKGLHLSLAALTWGALVLMVTFIWLQRDDKQTPSPRRKRVSSYYREKIPETVQNYISLTRPGVIPLLLIPAVAASLMAAVKHPTQTPVIITILLTVTGGALASGGAHAINQYLDRDIDIKMKRTKRRAVVTGRISPENSLYFGLFLSALGVGLLFFTVNPLASGLALLGNLFYVFVYTIWLKRTTAQNIVIGGAAGAVPPLVGWAAVTGNLELPALLFFAIIFFWTPAHFWALALVREEDYEAAGVPMLPVVKGEAYTRLNILLYVLVLFVMTLLPFALNSLSLFYFVVAVGLGLFFIKAAVSLMRRKTKPVAWNLFKYSNTYLALLYLAIIVDSLISLYR